MSDPTRSAGKHPFEYHNPNEEQTERIVLFRRLLKDTYDRIMEQVDPSRERSLAITKLEECSMWLNKAIVLEDKE
jgi:hypothetical protein